MEHSSSTKLSNEELSKRVQNRLQELEAIIADDPGDLSAFHAEHSYASTIATNIVKLVRLRFFFSSKSNLPYVNVVLFCIHIVLK